MSKIYGYTTIGQTLTPKQLSDVALAKNDLENHFKIRKGEKWLTPKLW